MLLAFDEKPVGAKTNFALFGFEASKVQTYEDYLSIRDTVSKKLEIPDVKLPVFLETCKPKSFKKIFADKLKPRGITDFRKAHNKFVYAGLEQVNKLLMGLSTASMVYSEVGTDATAAADGQTALLAALTPRLGITARYPEGQTISHFDTFWSNGDANGGGTANWVEYGTFTLAAGGVMFVRLTFSAYTKDATKTALTALQETLSSL